MSFLFGEGTQGPQSPPPSLGSLGEQCPLPHCFSGQRAPTHRGTSVSGPGTSPSQCLARGGPPAGWSPSLPGLPVPALPRVGVVWGLVRRRPGDWQGSELGPQPQAEGLIGRRWGREASCWQSARFCVWAGLSLEKKMGNPRIFHDFRPLGVRASQDPDPPPKVGRGPSQQQAHRGPIQPWRWGRMARQVRGAGRPVRSRWVHRRATVPPAVGRPAGDKGNRAGRAAATPTPVDGPVLIPGLSQKCRGGAWTPQRQTGETEAWRRRAEGSARAWLCGWPGVGVLLAGWEAVRSVARVFARAWGCLGASEGRGLGW